MPSHLLTFVKGLGNGGVASSKPALRTGRNKKVVAACRDLPLRCFWKHEVGVGGGGFRSIYERLRGYDKGMGKWGSFSPMFLSASWPRRRKKKRPGWDKSQVDLQPVQGTQPKTPLDFQRPSALQNHHTSTIPKTNTFAPKNGGFQ